VKSVDDPIGTSVKRNLPFSRGFGETEGLTVLLYPGPYAVSSVTDPHGEGAEAAPRLAIQNATPEIVIVRPSAAVTLEFASAALALGAKLINARAIAKQTMIRSGFVRVRPMVHTPVARLLAASYLDSPMSRMSLRVSVCTGDRPLDITASKSASMIACLGVELAGFDRSDQFVSGCLR
jgi:hypothetical protein